MTEKLSTDFVSSYLKKNGYYLFSEYIGASSPMYFSDDEGYKYSLSFDALRASLKKNNHPFRFYKKNIFSIENIGLWLKLNNKPFSLEGENVFISARDDKIKFRCHKCSSVFEMCWNSPQQNKGCSICGVKEGHLKRRASLDFVKNVFDKITISAIDISQFQGYGERMDVKCDKCGHLWSPRFGNIKSGYGCPKCNESKGEKAVAEALKKYNISYEPQRKFDGCFYKDKLKFDFFIPSKKTAIEYNGEQHYKVSDFSYSKTDKSMEKAKKDFEIIKIRDNIKKKYCRDNDIKLITISYKQFDEIDSIIKKINGGLK